MSKAREFWIEAAPIEDNLHIASSVRLNLSKLQEPHVIHVREVLPDEERYIQTIAKMTAKEMLLESLLSECEKDFETIYGQQGIPHVIAYNALQKLKASRGGEK